MPDSSRHHQGPLAGLRIVEFAGIGPAPFAAMMLADMGAEVIRLDRPNVSAGGGDAKDVVTRGRPKLPVDLKSATDLAQVLELLDGADALIEGFRPGVMERLGLGPDVVLARNPKLVYGRMTGWGQEGPLAQAAGHDINYIAITGALSAIGPVEHPVPPLNLVGDYGGGALYLIVGVLAAILSAKKTGKGQVVDCAICDGAASLMSLFSGLSAVGQWNDQRVANLLDGGMPHYRTFACSDGLHVSLGALEPQFYELFCTLVGFDGKAELARRDDASIRPDLHAKFAALFRTRTRAEWTELLEGTDACFAPVLTLSEAPEHPHLKSRGTFVTVDGVVQPAPAPRFSGTPSAIPPASGPTSLADVAASWRAARPA